MAEVQLESVEKQYENGTFAVKGISFMANDGEFVVLVGPSGCGKSTTLRMIAGLEEITGGAVRIGGDVVNDREPKDRDVAMVFQNYALYPHMTVFDNMAFPLKMRKVDKATITKQVEDAAQLLSITHLLKRKPKELSGGERQRVAVGRAIVRKPKVFLFDEPLSNLDAALRTQMRAELKRLQRRLGATMLYVTHDQVEAMTMGDKIAVLNKGELEQFGSPGEVYDRPSSTFVARFLGSPAMNLIEGKAANGVFESSLLTLALPDHYRSASGEVTLGVRPESIRVSKGNNLNGTEFVEGKLVLIEPIGSVTHFYIDAPGAVGGTLVASGHQGGEGIPGAESALLSTYSLGDVVKFTLSPTAVHLFDRSTGKRL